MPWTRAILMSNAMLALARTDNLGQRDDCPSTYATANGLTFNITCGTGLMSSIDYSPPLTRDAKDVYECALFCSEARNCSGGLFVHANNTCILKPQQQFTVNSLSNGLDVAVVAPTDQLTKGYEVACPFANLSTAITSTGMPATTYCGVDILGSDYCPSNNISCPLHAASLIECLDACSAAQPLCWGVAYDPTIKLGWANCYLKNQHPGPAAFRETANNPDYNGAIVHSALVNVENGTSIPYQCTEQEQLDTSNGQSTYITFCSANQVGNDGSKRHARSLLECLDACDEFNANGRCVAVAYDPKLTFGWENCYLKDTIVSTVHTDNMTLAISVQKGNASSPANTTSPSSTTSSNNTMSGTASSSHSNSESKAWIAGAVIGPIAAFTLLLGVALFLFRRNRSGRMPPNKPELHEKQELPTTASYRVAEAGDVGANQRKAQVELDGATRRLEMPA